MDLLMIRSRRHLVNEQFVEDYYEAGGTGAYKEGNPTAGYYNNGVATMAYKRLFIKHRK